MESIDPDSLSKWFAAHGRVLVLYARQWLGAESAEDVVQEVFIRLLSQSRTPANVKAWLYRSVRNAAISRVRSQKRRLKHEGYVAAEQPNWFEKNPGDLIDAETAQAALRSLPEAQREIIVLRIWAGLTLTEAAEVLGEPTSTLFSRYRTGLTALRAALEASCKNKNH